MRLREYGYNIGLVDIKTYEEFNQKKLEYHNLIEKAKAFRILPTIENNTYLYSKSSAQIYEAITVYDLLKRPEINQEDVKYFMGNEFSVDALEQLEIRVKYEGYIQKAQREAEKMNRLEDKVIPETIVGEVAFGT